MSDPTENEAHPAQPSESGESGDGGENAKAKVRAQSNAIPRLSGWEDFWSLWRFDFAFALGAGIMGILFKIGVVCLGFFVYHFKLLDIADHPWLALALLNLYSTDPMLNPNWWWYVLAMVWSIASLAWSCYTEPTAPSTLRGNIIAWCAIVTGYASGAMFFSWGMKTLFYSP